MNNDISIISVLIVGMATVFIGLIIMIFATVLMSFFLNKGMNKKDANIISPLPKTETKIDNNNDIVVKQDDNLSVVAAITAAISMILGENSQFVIRRIKRTNKIS